MMETTSADLGANPLVSVKPEPMDEDDSDPVVREIDLYMSPSLGPHLYLIQFPLTPMTDGSRAPVVPKGARLRPKQSHLQLDMPQEATGNLVRLYESQSASMSTHMAIGVMDSSGSSMNVIPLSRVIQMRPSFSHLDDPDDTAIEDAADYRATQEMEEWITLEIHGPGTAPRKEARRAIACPSKTTELGFVRGTNKNHNFVHTLNYKDPSALHQGKTYVDTEEGNVDSNASLKNLVAELTTMFQRLPVPVLPFSLIQARFPPTEYETDDLLVALASVTALVRGNFVLQSCLLMDHVAGSSEEEANIRDFTLGLMNLHGSIQRAKLGSIFPSCRSNILTSILKGFATQQGLVWVMKVDDDTDFLLSHPQYAERNGVYWQQRMREMADLVLKYQEVS